MADAMLTWASSHLPRMHCELSIFENIGLYVCLVLALAIGLSRRLTVPPSSRRKIIKVVEVKEVPSADKFMQQKEALRQEDAATAVQSLMRQASAKKQLKAMKQEMSDMNCASPSAFRFKKQAEAMKQEDAATTVQSLMRQASAKKQLKAMKQEMSDMNCASPSAFRFKKQAEAMKQEDAATTVQSLMRQASAKKQVKVMKQSSSPSPATVIEGYPTSPKKLQFPEGDSAEVFSPQYDYLKSVEEDEILQSADLASDSWSMVHKGETVGAR